MSLKHPLDSPRMRYRFNVDTEEPCTECIFYQPQKERGQEIVVDCAIHTIVIADAVRSTCPSWVNGIPCTGCDECCGETRRINRVCPWCDYGNEIEDVPDCQYDNWTRALEHLLGTHILVEHPDQIARVMEIFTGDFQAFCRLAVDAASKIGRLADYGRRSGRVVGNLQRKSDRIGK